MANVKTLVDEFEVQDLEDGSKIRVVVEHNTEMGNKSLPGLQVHCMGHIINYEPLAVERLAYQAMKKATDVLLLESESWTVHQDQFVKHYLVVANPPKARVEVKTRSKAKPVMREYALPFTLES